MSSSVSTGSGVCCPARQQSRSGMVPSHMPPSVGGSIASVAYCVVFVAGIELYRRGGVGARERERS
jgi:hypothetical protein